MSFGAFASMHRGGESLTEHPNREQLPSSDLDTHKLESMSLYYDAAPLLVPELTQSPASLKQRVFGAKNLKSSPAQVYALVTEASRWSPILKEVVEKCQLLELEKKVRRIPPPISEDTN